MKEPCDRYNLQEAGAKGVLLFELKEMLAAFEESFDDLSDVQVHTFPLPDRHNIAWCVMHLIENHNWYHVESQGGECLLPDEWDHERWNWQSPRPMPGQEFPSVLCMKNLAASIRKMALELLTRADENDFWIVRDARADETSKACYLRMLAHSNVHIREIWQIRGALALARSPVQRPPN